MASCCRGRRSGSAQTNIFVVGVMGQHSNSNSEDILKSSKHLSVLNTGGIKHKTGINNPGSLKVLDLTFCAIESSSDVF